MITDDDPVEINFLSEIYELYKNHPGFSIYCGFPRMHKNQREIEVISKDRFIMEILDADKTSAILWSSSVMKRQTALEVGKIPDYGSPHLADHAFIAMVGSRNGGIIVNKMFSSLTQHDNNFSKFNFHYYTTGCKGFFEKMTEFCRNDKLFFNNKEIIIKHLGSWFIANIFSLKKYYTIRKFRPIIFFKNQMFVIKRMLNLLQ
jgi:hypothetical protein